MPVKSPSSTPYLTFLNSFLQFLKAKGYTKDVLNNYRRTLVHIDDYIKEHGFKSYSTEIGNHYCDQYLSTRIIGRDRTGAVKVMIRRLNDYFDNGYYSLRELRAYNLFSDNVEDIISSYLESCRERGNKETTLKIKEDNVRQFLHKIFEECSDLSLLKASQIQHICVTTRNKDHWAKYREFLKYLCQNGILEKDLSTLVPHYVRGFHLPSTYSVEEMRALEDSIDRTTATGKRDYAIILLASRYGIRAGDITGMTFENIDVGTKRISFTQQKTGENHTMPLIPAVEDALVDYIQHARPKSDDPHLFLRVNAPFTPIMKNKSAEFMVLLESFFSEHLPVAVGASPNTIKSYKFAFRLLLQYSSNRQIIGVKHTSE